MEDPRSEDFPNLSAAQTMTALCQQYHKTKADEGGAEPPPMEASLLDRLTSLLEAKGVCGEDANAMLLSRELKKVGGITLWSTPKHFLISSLIMYRST